MRITIDVPIESGSAIAQLSGAQDPIAPPILMSVLDAGAAPAALEVDATGPQSGDADLLDAGPPAPELVSALGTPGETAQTAAATAEPVAPAPTIQPPPLPVSNGGEGQADLGKWSSKSGQFFR